MEVRAIIPELNLESYTILKTLIEIDEFGMRLSPSLDEAQIYPASYYCTTKESLIKCLEDTDVESLNEELPITLKYAEIEDAIDNIVNSLKEIESTDFIIVPTFESEIMEVKKSCQDFPS